MNRSKSALIIVLLAGLFIGAWLAFSPSPQDEEPVAASRADGLSKNSSSRGAPSSPLSMQARGDPSAVAAETSVSSEATSETVASSTLAEALKNLDPSNEVEFNLLLQKLKAEAGPEQGRQFIAALEENAGDSVFRDNLILLADNLQSADNLGFWKKIASRNPPPPGGDPEELGPEPTPKRLRADLEIRISLRNIRIMSSSNPQAKEVLKSLASESATGVIAKSVKANALNWLAEVDPREAARIRKTEALQQPL